MTTKVINTGRYSVDEEVIVCCVIYEDSVSVLQPLLYNNQMPESFIFKTLTVTEEHHVPDEYGDPSDLKYIGYRLIDEQQSLYNNQYPTASYGQLSDVGNRMFQREVQDSSIKNIKAITKNVKTNPLTFISVGEIYTPLVKALTVDRETLSQPKLIKLGLLKNMFDEIFARQYPDKKLVVEPIEWHKKDGSTVSYPDILKTVIKDR